MDKGGSGLSRTELAALDFVIAAIEDGTLDPAMLGGGDAERAGKWKLVAQVTWEIAQVALAFVGGVRAETEEDSRFASALEDLPENPSLDDLVALRRRLNSDS